jgi:hypothetical protein
MFPIHRMPAASSPSLEPSPRFHRPKISVPSSAPPSWQPSHRPPRPGYASKRPAMVQARPSPRRPPDLAAGGCSLFLRRPVPLPLHPLSLRLFLCAVDWASGPFHCRLSRSALYVPPSLTSRFHLNLNMCLSFLGAFPASSSQLRFHRYANLGQTSILLSDSGVYHTDFIPAHNDFY